MTKYLITGGCGFIGSNFIQYLLDQEPSSEIVNLDALTYAGNPENLDDISESSRYHFMEGDIANKDTVLEAMDSSTDVVVHFAAESHVDRSINDESPFVHTNVLGTQILLNAAKQRNVSRFIHVSTDEVYGSAPEGVSFSESDKLNPGNPYSASKASSDLLVNAYINTHHFPAIITRCTNNYGPYQFPEKFIPLFITNALDGNTLPLYGDGTNVRDWLYVLDHCDAIYQIIKNGNCGEIYNIAGNYEKPNKEVAYKIVDLLDVSENLIKQVEDRPGHDFRYSLDTTKIEEEIGWTPEYSFDSGLKRTIQWYLDHEEWWRALQSR